MILLSEKEDIKKYIREKLDEGMSPAELRSALKEVKMDSSFLDEILDERSMGVESKSAESKKLRALSLRRRL